MKIFVDENIPLMTVRALRKMGHDVVDIRGTTDEGMTDDNLWEVIQRERRLLITDFHTEIDTLIYSLI